MAKKKAPQDLTLRNLRALKRRIVALEARVSYLEAAVRIKARQPMLKPHGQITINGDGPVQEFDTITCGHCGRIVQVKAGGAATVYLVVNPLNIFGPLLEEPGAGCRVCMRAVCLRCYDKGTCTPLERQIEQMERTGRH